MFICLGLPISIWGLVILIFGNFPLASKDATKKHKRLAGLILMLVFPIQFLLDVLIAFLGKNANNPNLLLVVVTILELIALACAITGAILISRHTHHWSEWEYVSISSCDQKRYCKQCKEAELRQAIHDWEDWKYKPNSCEQMRECKHCHQQDTKVATHDWGVWTYIASDSCERVQICRRCHKEITGITTDHNWGEWTYAAPDSCEQVQICRRCHKENTGKVTIHDWGDWDYLASDSTMQVRICKRCQTKETRKAFHYLPSTISRNLSDLTAALASLPISAPGGIGSNSHASDREFRDVTALAIELLAFSEEHNNAEINHFSWGKSHELKMSQSLHNQDQECTCYRIGQDTWLLRLEWIDTDW